MTAAPRVPSIQARGTFRLGFSTASEFCAADSMPRKAQRVSAMLEPMPCPKLSPFGFHASPNLSALNQSQPMTESPATGMMTPQTVTEPIRPVTLGPPKFAIVVSQSSAITPMQVEIGVAESHGKNDERYPRAEMAMATFPIASERK